MDVLLSLTVDAVRTITPFRVSFSNSSEIIQHRLNETAPRETYAATCFETAGFPSRKGIDPGILGVSVFLRFFLTFLFCSVSIISYRM